MKMIFKVFYKQNDEMVTLKFDTFAKAAGHASGLDGISRFIDVEFKGQDWSHSGSMYIYSKNNDRRVGSQYMVDWVTKTMSTKN